jgi:hypothetical protein
MFWMFATQVRERRQEGRQRDEDLSADRDAVGGDRLRPRRSRPRRRPAEGANTPYFARVDVRRDARTDATTIAGAVFDDANRNGRLDAGEPGVPDVKVSNGREVVLTDAKGGYRLPARSDMAVFVVQPSGWRVPTDERWVPQFAYQHKPAGSPKALRYGGLPPTGPLPSAINFPIIRPTRVSVSTARCWATSSPRPTSRSAMCATPWSGNCSTPRPSPGACWPWATSSATTCT